MVKVIKESTRTLPDSNCCCVSFFYSYVLILLCLRPVTFWGLVRDIGPACEINDVRLVCTSGLSYKECFEGHLPCESSGLRWKWRLQLRFMLCHGISKKNFICTVEISCIDSRCQWKMKETWWFQK